jgi:hypothetical protein
VVPVTVISGGSALQGQVVSVAVRPGDFADPEAELPRLEAQLTRHLRDRSVLGFDLRVEVRPDA